MKKIYEKLQVPLHKGDVGIEIEMEGRNLPGVNAVYWSVERDGSLRGEFPNYSCEYVLRGPLALSSVKDAIVELKTLLEKHKSIVEFSFRTSVHVHLNVQALTEEQVLNLIYTYALLEDVFMNYAGKERRYNRFCLSLQDAEATLEVIRDFIKYGTDAVILKREGDIRYAAINLASMMKYGSIEFRAMRGTLDQGILLNWVNGLMCLRRYAEKHVSVTEIYNRFIQIGPKAFAEEVLEAWLPSLQYNNMVQDINKNFSLSLDIPFEYARLRKEPQKEKKVLNKLKNPFIPQALIDEILNQGVGLAQAPIQAAADPWEAIPVELEQNVRVDPPVRRIRRNAE